MINKLLEKYMCAFLFMGMLSFAPSLLAQDYQLGPGDQIRITVFQNEDMTLETRVSDSGTINYPLIGTVQVGGLSTSAAEQLIADKLKSGNFVRRPQVNIALLEIRSSQVSVMGMVNSPGRFPLETNTMRLSQVIAGAGGVLPAAGTGTAIIAGQRNGSPTRTEVDLASLYLSDSPAEDPLLRGGDVVYVMPGNQVSIQGQVNRPGRYPLESNKMRLSEVLTMAGGAIPEASDIVIVSGQRNGQSFRKEVDIPALFLDEDGGENILIAAGDEIYVQRPQLFYIYGEAQKPGSYRVERNMSVIQALAQGGGPTVRGTQRKIKVLRRNDNGETEELQPKLTDMIQAEDVIFVRESLF